MAENFQIQMIPIGSEGKVIKDTAKLFVTLNDAVRDEVAEGVRYMSVYPAAKPGSTYIRTGTLRRSWNFDVKSGMGRIEGIVGSQSNIAPYNEDVQGENQESLFKQIGWRNTGDLQDKFDREVAKNIQGKIDKYFD